MCCRKFRATTYITHEGARTANWQTIDLKCFEARTKDVQWYTGTVMGIESTHNDPVKTEYRVKYGEDEETWVFFFIA